MKHLILVLLVTCFSIQAYGQDDQIITVKGDTLLGKVSVIRKNGIIETIILKNDREKTVFKIYEIKTLKMDKEVYYTIKINSYYQLGKLIKEGYLSLYKFTASGDNASQPFSSSILIKLDGSQLVVPNLGFKRHVKNFLEDCSNVVVNFEANAYNKGNLNKIIDDYNGCIAENTADFNKQVIAGNQNSEKAEQIKDLIDEIEKDKTLEKRSEVVEMLNDLMDKTKNNVKAPSYLENALRESLKSDSSYSEQINKILNKD